MFVLIRNLWYIYIYILNKINGKNIIVNHKFNLDKSKLNKGSR